MKRAQAIDLIKVAGYHGDQKSFVRLYVENRIGLPVARRAFSAGAEAMKSGAKCSCFECAAKGGAQ